MTSQPRRTPTALERASLPALRRMSELPRWLPFAVIAVLLAAGALLPFGWICTLLVASFLVWMAAVSWSALTGVERLMRAAVIFLVLAVAATQAFPR